MGTASGVLRNQKTATRTKKGEEYATHYTAKFWKTPPQAAATVYCPLTDDEGSELAAGVRPTPLAEGRPQGMVWAVYTGTRPGFPCHQGGEGVAGTPGACSQLFCHPNSVHHTHAHGQTRRDVNYWYHTHHL